MCVLQRSEGKNVLEVEVEVEMGEDVMESGGEKMGEMVEGGEKLTPCVYFIYENDIRVVSISGRP